MKNYTHCGVKTLIPGLAFRCCRLPPDLSPSFTCLKKGTRSSKFGTRNVSNFSRGAYRFGISWKLLGIGPSKSIKTNRIRLTSQKDYSKKLWSCSPSPDLNCMGCRAGRSYRFTVFYISTRVYRYLLIVCFIRCVAYFPSSQCKTYWRLSQ